MYNQIAKQKISGALHVADLAREAEVTPATVRYYSRIGLLSPDREAENGYRCFTAIDLHRLIFIRQSQSLGLTIGDIKEILKSVDHGAVPCHQVKSLVEARLQSIQDRLADLYATETRIVRALKSWEKMHDVAPSKDELCPLIERLEFAEEQSAPLPCRPATDDSCRCEPEERLTVSMST